MKRVYFWLFIIVFIATLLRFFNLGMNAPSLTWDEVAWGYNGYSLGVDGRDEFGRFLPLNYLESFGDFKPPMYAYLAVIPVKVFGLSEFATRFPSAFFGVLTVLATFFLVKSIFGKESEMVALLSTFFLAISPWHINLSRAAFEANIASFFIILGIWLFIKSVKDSEWFMIPSVVSFTLSLYTFNTARIVSPLIFFVLFIYFWKKILTRKKAFVVAALVGFILILPTLKFLFSPQASLRFREVNIFSDPQIIVTSNREIKNDNNIILSKLIHNRRLEYSVLYLKHYFDNLNPDFLFIKGDGNPKFSTQDVGQMYLWDIPFFILGLIMLFKQKKGFWWIIPIWILIGILPAATARETPHALRIETTLPAFQIITAVGFVWVINLLKGKYRINVLLIFILLLFFNFLYYLHGYYVHYPRIFSGEWQYGYKDSIAYVQSEQSKYQRINITSELGRPYIYYLFFSKTNPEEFRAHSTVTRDVFGFVSVINFDKYYFDKDPNSLKNLPGKTLFINTPKNVPGNAKVLKTFYLLNGEPVLIAYTL